VVNLKDNETKSNTIIRRKQ